ncbi:MAG: hypothetical protein WC647_10120 [Desulfomonilaceae bacterium]|jgi:hypothetical protein
MHVTFDTNVINPLACPDMYEKTCPDMASVDVIRESIQSGRIHAYLSEASTSLEAISNEERLDSFLRQFASGKIPIQLPKPSSERIRVFSEAIQLGLRVLHAPRLGLTTFIEFPETAWAEDTNYLIDERQHRYHEYIRFQPDTGVETIKRLDAELIGIHGLGATHLSTLPSSPIAANSMWKGLLAEYGSPIKFRSKKKFLAEFRDRVAEWFDMDIQASHYAYGHDYLCTFDSGSKAGPYAIMHPNRVSINSSRFGIQIVSPSELDALIT